MNDAPPVEALLRIDELKVHFPVLGGVWRRAVATCKAVDGVSFEVFKGETLGLVGESGCGKSTLARSIVGLNRPTSGKILLEGRELKWFSGASRKMDRRRVQMVFQDPSESLDARQTVGQIIDEPMMIHDRGNASERTRRVGELLSLVGLSEDAALRYPFEFSGGQRQRIGIARALALSPELLVLDEPVSALDLSIRSQVINLLLDLKIRLGLTCVFIAHDLSVVRHLSDRIAVMYLGKLVELAPAQELLANPMHAYTKALIEAIPRPDPDQNGRFSTLRGEVPSPINPPPGCAFGHRVQSPLHALSVQRPSRFVEASPGHWLLDCPCCTDRGKENS